MRKFLTRFFLALSIILGITTPLLAEDEPPAELFQADRVHPLERSRLQLTIKPQYRDGPARDLVQFPLLANYGITDAWQAGLEWPFFAHSNRPTGSANGVGDLRLNTQYSFMNLPWWDLQAAVGFVLLFPTGNDNNGLGEGHFGYNPFGIIAKNFSNFFDLHAFFELGGELNKDDPNPFFHTGVYFPVWQLRPSLEFGYAGTEWLITPGINWLLPHNWEAGLGISIGLNGRADNVRITGALTYHFSPFGQSAGDDYSNPNPPPAPVVLPQPSDVNEELRELGEDEPEDSGEAEVVLPTPPAESKAPPSNDEPATPEGLETGTPGELPRDL